MGQGGRDLTLAFALHEVEEGGNPGRTAGGHEGRPYGRAPNPEHGRKGTRADVGIGH